MKIKISEDFGLYNVYAGVLLFVFCYFSGWTRYNFLLLTGLLLVIVGIVIYVIAQKHNSRY